MNIPKHGIGLEVEGFILNAIGEPKVRIKDLPSSEWVIREIEGKYPILQGNVSVEQASVMLEVKTGVHTDEQNAIEEIQRVRATIDNILMPVGCRLVFQPVLGRSFEFVPASSDPNSRAQQLIREWGSTPEGRKKLNATAIASFQINDSRPFKDVQLVSSCLKVARRIYNVMGAEFENLNALNPRRVDYEGKTRMERLFELLQSVKAEQFIKRGFSLKDIVIPPHFGTVEEMEKWLCAHSDVDDAQKVNPKDAHAVTVKIKREPWIAETRVFDAVDGKAEMARLIKENNGILARA